MQTVTIPPKAAGGGECGEPALFVAGCLSDFRGEGQLIVLSIHNLQPDDAVVWTAVGDTSNYLVGTTGLLSDYQSAMIGYFSGAFTVSVTVNGTSIGTFDVETDYNDEEYLCYSQNNPR